ncbi:unnamed protein product [Heterobilharzia americana]|nr:unnamed protein product [Heterobilharzia americana]
MSGQLEAIYHQCYAVLIHTLKVKKRIEKFDRGTAEKEVEKIKSTSSTKIHLLFSKDCLRIKRFAAHKKRYESYTLCYDQIEVYYLTHDMKNLIILGIVSPCGQKRSYQYLRIDNEDNLFKIQTILYQIFEDPSKQLTEFPSIGQLIIRGSNKKSSSTIIGRLTMDNLNNPQVVDYLNRNRKDGLVNQIIEPVEQLKPF